MQVRRLVAAISLLLLTGCGLGEWLSHPVDPITRPISRLDKTPEVFVRLSVPYQVCAAKDDTAQVVVFVYLLWLPPQVVELELTNGKKIQLYGSIVSATLEHVGLGEHTFKIRAAGKEVETSFSVWRCGGGND